MKPSHLIPLGLIILLGLVISQIYFASAANNTIPATNLDAQSQSVGVEDLAPEACRGMGLSSMISGSGTITGTSGNDLILGGTGADVIDGGGGDDCLVGGAGDDTLIGGEGSDVCLGGSGNDLIDPSCE
ncbi:hypothetical protein OSCT_2562 [Oscillochloris trichoides DG-6]|uniref:Hemolysin-type calcium-binding region n=1 Tax=Oscillochloris trichoides DG-6 TaxID=765420 RepID=E1IGW1_9CHLR|nr:hypothetical protein [Oscillochloris trichoides]EFO79436.1 hypothetical protein OSCT_2562 [Oscillochloris trichoides DG-6]